MRLDTLGAIIDYGYSIRAHCRDCRHNADLDLEALALKLGRDHGSLHDDLTPKLKCSACGSKNIGIRLTKIGPEYKGYPAR